MSRLLIRGLLGLAIASSAACTAVAFASPRDFEGSAPWLLSLAALALLGAERLARSRGKARKPAGPGAENGS